MRAGWAASGNHSQRKDYLTGSISPRDSQEDRADQLLPGRPEVFLLVALQITRNHRVMEEADADPLHRHPELTECEQSSFILFELVHRFAIANMELGL
jgi:hypothetical protein